MTPYDHLPDADKLAYAQKRLCACTQALQYASTIEHKSVLQSISVWTEQVELIQIRSNKELKP